MTTEQSDPIDHQITLDSIYSSNPST